MVTSVARLHAVLTLLFILLVWHAGLVQTGFALLVIGYMLYVSFFDVQDLGGGDAGQQYEIVFEAPQASE